MMSSPALRIGCLVTAALLAGCAHDPGPPPSVDLAALHCAATPDLASATPLLFNPKKDSSLTFTIDGGAGCVETGGGRSLYRLFTLPDGGVPYIFSVSAQQWGNTILAPEVTLLGEDGAIKRHAQHTEFAFRGTGLTALFRSHADERVLMVSSDPEFAGHSLSRIVTATHETIVPVGTTAVAVYTGSDTAADLQLSPAGTVTITLSPLPDK
jgi:hypothetical protein